MAQIDTTNLILQGKAGITNAADDIAIQTKQVTKTVSKHTADDDADVDIADWVTGITSRK